MAFSFLKGIDDDHCFDAEATMVTSKNIQNLKCLYNYKCFVSGGERFFIMGLGVSVTHLCHTHTCHTIKEYSQEYFQVKIGRKKNIRPQLEKQYSYKKRA